MEETNGYYRKQKLKEIGWRTLKRENYHNSSMGCSNVGVSKRKSYWELHLDNVIEEYQECHGGTASHHGQSMLEKTLRNTEKDSP